MNRQRVDDSPRGSITDPIEAKQQPDGNAAGGRRADILQFIEFKLAGQCYAFRIGQIREIVILEDVTPVPQVAHYVDGVCNLRGAIIPIINLRALFGIQRNGVHEETRTIVVNVGEKTMGCTVDGVTRVLKLREKQIQPAPDTVTDGGAGYISGLAKVDEYLVIILDVDRLFDVKKLHLIESAKLSGITNHGN